MTPAGSCRVQDPPDGAAAGRTRGFEGGAGGGGRVMNHTSQGPGNQLGTIVVVTAIALLI